MEMNEKNEAEERQESPASSEEAPEEISEEMEEKAEAEVAAEAGDAPKKAAAGRSGSDKSPKKAASRKTRAKKSAKPAAKKEAAAKSAAAEAAPLDEEQPDDGPERKWYVIHTYSGHENKVRENIMKMVNQSSIRNHFGQLVVPTEEVAEMKKGKKTVTTRKFFPSYILIEMHMSDDAWHLVNSIPGVTSFVGAGDKPQPLSKPEVERILGRMDKEKQTIIPEIPFTLGEHIRIKDGPFSDFTGVIDEINAEKGKLKVLVSIFGRETPVELDFLQVETVS
jgi:transcriptional antiterminator NusG